MKKEELKMYRYFLKDSIRKKIDFRFTDQNQGIPAPPIEKPWPDGSNLIDLPGPDVWKNIPQADLTMAIGNRKSHRVYLKQSLSLEELAYLQQLLSGSLYLTGWNGDMDLPPIR